MGQNNQFCLEYFFERYDEYKQNSYRFKILYPDNYNANGNFGELIFNFSLNEKKPFFIAQLILAYIPWLKKPGSAPLYFIHQLNANLEKYSQLNNKTELYRQTGRRIGIIYYRRSKEMSVKEVKELMRIFFSEFFSLNEQYLQFRMDSSAVRNLLETLAESNIHPIIRLSPRKKSSSVIYDEHLPHQQSSCSDSEKQGGSDFISTQEKKDSKVTQAVERTLTYS